jgi:transposase, IS30 family
MARYHRLSLMEREELSRMLAAGYSLRAIGQALSRALSTLSRELARQHASPVTYRAVSAQQRAQRWAHRPCKPRKLAVQPRLRTAVFTLLAQRWSPEQIAHGLPQRYPHEPTMRISHEAIYTYLYVLPRGAFKRELVRYLRRRHRFRRLRKMRLSSRPIQDLITIDERPIEVADRTAPLWGLGKRIFFLHDGRTKDLLEAIQAHARFGGGQYVPAEGN